MKKPAEKYIRRNGVQNVSLQLRVDAKIKSQAKLAAKKLKTSLNKLSEAALTWYLETLKKDGLL